MLCDRRYSGNGLAPSGTKHDTAFWYCIVSLAHNEWNITQKSITHSKHYFINLDNGNIVSYTHYRDPESLTNQGSPGKELIKAAG